MAPAALWDRIAVETQGSFSFISSDRLAFRHCPAAHLAETAVQLQKSALSSMILHKEAEAQTQEFIDMRCHRNEYLILIGQSRHSLVRYFCVMTNEMQP